MLRDNPHVWQLLWSFVVAGLAVGWLLAPASLSAVVRTAGCSATGLAVGLAATRTTGSIVRASYAVVIGLLAAALWLDAARPADAAAGQPTLRGVVAQVVAHRALFGLALSSALVGGALAASVPGPRARHDS